MRRPTEQTLEADGYSSREVRDILDEAADKRRKCKQDAELVAELECRKRSSEDTNCVKSQTQK